MASYPTYGAPGGSDTLWYADLKAYIDAVPGGGVYDLSQNGCALDGTTDDSTALAALVAAVPSGSMLWHPGGICKLVTGIDLGTKPLTICGPFGPAYTSTAIGAWFATGTSGMTLFSSGTSTTVNEVGQTMQRVGFYDAAGPSTSTAHFIQSINRMRFIDCAYWNFLTARKWDHNGHDSAYHVSRGCSFYMTSASSFCDDFVKCLGFTDYGMTVITGGTVARIAPGVSSVQYNGATVGGGFITFDCQGYFCEFHGCRIEWTSAGSTRIGYKFYGDGTGSSGRENKVFGGRVSGQGAGHYIFQTSSTALGCEFVGVSANNLASPPWTDAGTETYIDIPSYGTFTNLPYRKIGQYGSRGAKAAFFGATEIAKPTVSGSVGGSAITITERYAALSTGQAGTTGFNTTTTVTAGTTAVLFATHGADKVLSSVADSGGNTWTVDATTTDGTRTASSAHCPVVTAITSITATWSNATAGTEPCIWVQELTAMASSPYNTGATGSGVGTAAATSATPTLSQANEIAFAVWKNSAGSDLSKDAAWTNATTRKLDNVSALEYLITSATTALTPTVTWTTSGTWVGLCVTYKGSVTALAMPSLLSALSSLGLITNSTS